MSAPTNGYSIRLVYYGRADFRSTKYDVASSKMITLPEPIPQVSTQNIRIVPFATPDPESFPVIAIYEIVKNAEAPKSDLEGTKI